MDILGALSAKAAYARPVWKSTSTPSSRRSYGDNVASMATHAAPSQNAATMTAAIITECFLGRKVLVSACSKVW